MRMEMSGEHVLILARNDGSCLRQIVAPQNGASHAGHAAATAT